MANLQELPVYLGNNDIKSITELIETKSLTDETLDSPEKITASTNKNIESCIEKDIELRSTDLLTTLLLHYDRNEIAKRVAAILGRMIYASKTDEALHIINQFTPLLEDCDWINDATHPPLITAVFFKNITVMRALTPKLTLAQLEKTQESHKTALFFAIQARDPGMIKVICKRGLELIADATNYQEIKAIADKIIRQINGEGVILNEKEHAIAQKSGLKNYYLAYFQNCSALYDFNALRQNFFLAFKYLNHDNKRSGFFSNTFGNHALSRDITQAAIALKNQISDIDSNSENAMEQLLNCVVQGITSARRHRSDHATEYHFEDYGRDPMMREGWSVSYDYKKPYANGSFEKNIIAALQKIKPLSQQSIQDRIDGIINDIKSYKPIEERSNEQTYAP